MGTIHNWYIDEYEESGNEIKLLGLVHGNGAQSGRDSHDIQNYVGASFVKNPPMSSKHLRSLSWNSFSKSLPLSFLCLSILCFC